MTERTLPPLGLGRSLRRDTTSPIPAAAKEACAADAPRTRQAAARAAARRSEAILSTPTRAGILLGGSAAAYALTLAGIAILQAQSDAQVIAVRQPWVDQVAERRAANDALEGDLVKIDAEARALAADYGKVGATVTDFQGRLDTLAALVAEVQGSAAALPTRIALPSVSMHGSVGGKKAPATSSTTGASGG